MRTLLISTILMLSLATPVETVTAANTHSRQTASVCQRPQRDRHKKHKRHKRKRHYIITGDKVYYDRQAVSGASASSFKEMKDGYAADDFTVYYEGKKIGGATAMSFKVLGDGYATDEMIFIRPGVMQAANRQTLKRNKRGQSGDRKHVHPEQNKTRVRLHLQSVCRFKRHDEQNGQKEKVSQKSAPKGRPRKTARAREVEKVHFPQQLR